MRNGLQAASAATIRPARRETSFAAAPYATGMTATPASAENERSPASPWPNTWVQDHASR